MVGVKFDCRSEGFKIKIQFEYFCLQFDYWMIYIMIFSIIRELSLNPLCNQRQMSIFVGVSRDVIIVEMKVVHAWCTVSSKRPVSVKISERNFTFLEKENEATVNNPNNLTSIKSNTFAVMQKKMIMTITIIITILQQWYNSNNDDRVHNDSINNIRASTSIYLLLSTLGCFREKLAKEINPSRRLLQQKPQEEMVYFLLRSRFV